MKIITILAPLLVFSSGTPLSGPTTNRRYLPEENDPFRIKHLYFRDKEGNLRFEDLTKSVPLPRVTASDLALYIFTRNNLEEGVHVRINDLEDLKYSQVFDPKKPNYFIIHGWHNDHNSTVGVILREAILKQSDANVFVVDWGETASGFYVTSTYAVQPLGEFLGDFVNMMMDHYELKSENIRIIGHSLGAHLSGCAGARIKGRVDYIVGLDPAGPLYTIGNTEARLDETDADFVHVIHTCDSLLGFGSAIGDADYYPNGGSSQTGCGFDLTGACAHSRAYYYFEESILLSGFTSLKCDSYGAFKRGECNNNERSSMGTLNINKGASGDFYLQTNGKSPYSIN